MNILTYLIIGFVVTALLGYMRKPKAPKGQTVTMSVLLAVIGLIAVVFFGALAVWAFFDEGMGTAVLFLPFVLLGVCIIVAYINCRITYDENGFTVKNFWGVTRSYTYREITWMKGSRDVKLYVGDRKVTVDELAVGKLEFLMFAEAQYRKTHGGRPIPTEPPEGKRKSFDLFNGNLENPEEFILVYAILLVSVLVMFGVLAYDALPVKAEELQYATIQVERYEKTEDDLQLYARGEALPFELRGYLTSLEDAEAFLDLCGEQAVLEVGYISYENADEPYHLVHYAEDDTGTVQLTMEGAHREEVKRSKEVALGAAGMALLVLFFIAASIYVARHPERFSPRIVRLFYKEGYIRMPSDRNEENDNIL